VASALGSQSLNWSELSKLVESYGSRRSWRMRQWTLRHTRYRLASAVCSCHMLNTCTDILQATYSTLHFLVTACQ